MGNNIIGVGEESTPFMVTDEGSLNWTFRKMRDLKGAIAKKEELAKAEYERLDEEKKLVDDWLESETKGLKQSFEHFETLVRMYHEQLLESDDGQKTLSSPFGKHKSTRRKAQPKKADDELLLNYAKANNLDDLINVEESVRWGDLKERVHISGNHVVDENGVVVEGVEVEPETITFKVEIL